MTDSISKRVSSVLAITLAALLALPICGCSRDKYPKRYKVSGAVTFPDGEPVRTGVVEFIPTEGNLTANGEIDREGNFTLTTISNKDGAVPGKYRVVIKQFIFYDKVPEHKHDHGGDVAVVFADENSTPLKFDVEKKANSANFEVTYREKMP